MWSNLPEGGAGTKRKQSSVRMPVNLLILGIKKNLVNFVLIHAIKLWHSNKLSVSNTGFDASTRHLSPSHLFIILLGQRIYLGLSVAYQSYPDGCVLVQTSYFLLPCKKGKQNVSYSPK